MKNSDGMAVIFKNSSATGQRRSWSLAQPNLEHKPLTQDQIREKSMKYLTPAQRRNFELNTKLNKRGSLFGPKRDQPREKTPPDANPEAEQDAKEEEEMLPKPNLSVFSTNDVNLGNVYSMASLVTTGKPKTNASVRGSAVTEDMKLLTSILPSMSLLSAMSRASLDTLRRTALEKTIPFRINDWFKLEQKGEYLGKRKHFLRVINTLDYDEKVMQVSNYQILHELVEFYAKNYNSNAHNYVWKDIWGNTLWMNKSLGENGLMDKSLIIDELGLDHFPTILIYFKDGFQDEPPMRLDISKIEPDGITVSCRNY